MWISNLDAIDLLIRGMLIGAMASAPMGPAGILTVQRTLNKGRWYGFVTGVGAAVSDMLYALAAGLGMSFVMVFIEEPTTMLYLKLAGSVMLMLFGYYLYQSRPTTMHKPSGRMGTLTHNGLTGFLVTLSNPLIVLLFLVLMARFEFVVPDHPLDQAFGYLGILGGALLWWFCLTATLSKVGSRFRMESVRKLNRVLGLLVMAASLVGFLYMTLTQCL